MTKLEVRTIIEDVLSAHKETKVLIEIKAQLMERFESKVSTSDHPPVLDDDNQIIEVWCKFHKRYEVIGDMVLSKGKSKGYCKAGISEWNKRMKASKVSSELAIKALSEGDVELATSSAQEAERLKESARDYDTYDYDSDWDTFTPASK